MRLNDHFEKVICINLRRREDRWENVQKQCMEYGFEVERFDAYDSKTHPMDGKPNGNFGCTSSHRAVLELCAFHKWKSCLILEDDFQIVDTSFNEMLEEMMKDVPPYDMLYLGGHYGEQPVARVNSCVIRIGRMLTTSSYAVTWQFARKIAPYISGIGPIDSLYGGFHRANRCYIFSPRLMVQYPNVSDLQDRFMDNSQCMLDTGHESALDGVPRDPP